MKQKAFKILSLICTIAIMLSVVSVGFVARAAGVVFYTSDTAGGYPSENLLANSDIIISATDGTNVELKYTSPDSAEKKELVNGVKDDDNTPGSDLLNAGNNSSNTVKQTDAYLQYTFDLNGSVSNPTMFVYTAHNITSVAGQYISVHYEIFASDYLYDLYDAKNSIYLHSATAGAGVQHVLDLTNANLTNIKYLGARFYHRPYSDKKMHAAEIGLFGGTYTADAVTFTAKDTISQTYSETNHLTNGVMSFVNGGIPLDSYGGAIDAKLYNGVADSVYVTDAVKCDNGIFQAHSYWQSKYTLAAPINNPEKFIVATGSTWASNSDSTSQRYTIFASSDEASLFNEESIVYEYISTIGNGEGVEHEIDISGLKLKNVKYFGVRFYHRSYGNGYSDAGKTMLLSEIGLYGGKAQIETNNSLTADYATAFGANQLANANMTASIADETGAATWTGSYAIPDKTKLTNGLTDSTSMIQSTEKIGAVDDYTQTAEYIQLQFEFADAISNPDEFVISYDANGGTYHYSLFASDSVSTLYDTPIFTRQVNSDSSVEHIVDLSNMELKGIKYFAVRFYHLGYYGTCILPYEIGVYGGEQALSAKNELTSEDGSYAKYGENRFATADVEFTIVDPENPDQLWSGDSQNPYKGQQITKLHDNSSGTVNHIQPAFGIGSVGDITQTAEYIEVKYDLKQYISNPEKFMLVARGAGEMPTHYAIFASNKQETLFDAPVYEFASTNVAGVREHHIDLSFFNLEDIRYFSVRFYATYSGGNAFLLLHEIGLYGGESSIQNNSEYTSDANGSYASKYGSNHLYESTLTNKVVVDGEVGTTTWQDWAGAVSCLTDNLNTAHLCYTTKPSVYADYSQTAPNSYFDFDFKLSKAVNNPETFLIAHNVDSGFVVHNWYAVYAASTKEELDSSEPIFVWKNQSGTQKEQVFDISALELKNISFLRVRYYHLSNDYVVSTREIGLYGGKAQIETNNSLTADYATAFGANQLANANMTASIADETGAATWTGSYAIPDKTKLTNGLTDSTSMIQSTEKIGAVDDYTQTAEYIQLQFELAHAISNPDEFVISYDASGGTYHYSLFASDSVSTLYDTPIFTRQVNSDSSVEHIVDLSNIELKGIKYFAVRFYHLGYYGTCILPYEIGLYGGEVVIAASWSSTDSFGGYPSTPNHFSNGTLVVSSTDGTNLKISDNTANWGSLTDKDGSVAKLVSAGGDYLNAGNNSTFSGTSNDNAAAEQTSAYLQLTINLNGTVSQPESFYYTAHNGTPGTYISAHYEIFASDTLYDLYEAENSRYLHKGTAMVGLQHKIDISALDLPAVKYFGIRYYHRAYADYQVHLSELGLYGGTYTASNAIYSESMSYSDSYPTNNHLKDNVTVTYVVDGNNAGTGSMPAHYYNGTPDSAYHDFGFEKADNSPFQNDTYMQYEYTFEDEINAPEKFIFAAGTGWPNMASQRWTLFASSDQDTLYNDESIVYEYISYYGGKDTAFNNQPMEQEVDLTGLNLTGIKYFAIRFYHRSYSDKYSLGGNMLFVSEMGLYGGVVNGGEEGRYHGGDGSEENPYIIATASELAELVQDFETAGKFYKLSNDIILNDETTENSWKTSSTSLEYHFDGTFDGDGHVISGIIINNAKENRVGGLFPSLRGNVTIKNLGIVNSSISLTGAGTYAGAIAGAADGNFTIENCFVASSVSVYATEHVAGMIGKVDSSTEKTLKIENAYSLATLSGGKYKESEDAYCRYGIFGYLWHNYTGSVKNVYTINYDAFKGDLNTVTAENVYSDEKFRSWYPHTCLWKKEYMLGNNAKKHMEFDYDTIWNVKPGYFPFLRIFDIKYAEYFYMGTPGEPWDGRIAQAYDGGSGSSGDPFLISSAAQLAKLVGSDINETSNNHYKLTQDIIINDTSVENWVANAIKWYDSSINSEYHFDGTFDGDGHTVSGLYINNDTNESAGGLFRTLGSSATIKNLGIVNSSITLTGTAACAGAIAGVANGDVNISQCYVDSDVSISATGHVAGLIGKVNSNEEGKVINIENTYSLATLSGSNTFGLFGLMSSNYTGNVKNVYTFDYALFPNDTGVNIKTLNEYSSVELDKANMTGFKALKYLNFDWDIWAISPEKSPYLRIFTNETELHGDINCDDSVNVADLLGLKKYSLDISSDYNTANNIIRKISSITSSLNLMREYLLYNKWPNEDFTPENSSSSLAGYKYVWGDEFNGTGLDTSTWSFEDTQTADITTNTSIDCIKVEDGTLTLGAHRKQGSPVTYDAAPWVQTNAGMNFKYGYVEMRAKIPFNTGAFPSFWISNISGAGRNSYESLIKGDCSEYAGEVDIFEYFGDGSTLSGYDIETNMHKWYTGTDHAETANDGSQTFRTYGNYPNPNEYHTYGFEWTEEYMKMYCDGTLYATYDITENGNFDADGHTTDMSSFHDPAYLRLGNLFYLKNDKNNKDVSTSYSVDWIRLYQKDGSQLSYKNRYYQSEEHNLTFTLFSDFHYLEGCYLSRIADLNTIFDRANEANSDFIIQAGDFSNDLKGSPELTNAYHNNKYNLKAYGIYGNHELEYEGNTMSSVTKTLTNDSNVVWGTSDGKIGNGSIGYYYYDVKGFRVICTDTNYSYNPTKQVWEHNKTESYRLPDGNTNPNALGPDQLEWLENVLMDAANKDIPCIVFGHDTFNVDYPEGASSDAEAVSSIFKKVNDKHHNTVIMSINGHHHSDGPTTVKNGVVYFSINSSINGYYGENAGKYDTSSHTYIKDTHDSRGNLISSREAYMSELDSNYLNATNFFASPLSTTIRINNLNEIVIENCETTWLYNVEPTSSDESYSLKVTGGTYRID